MRVETLAIHVRGAAIADSARICEIYNEGITDRIATLETELRTPAEREEWLRARSPRTPAFVAERERTVVGWASLNAFNPRKAYEHVADFSVYVERARRGEGIGRALLDHLIASARSLGYHKLVLAALARNAAGRRLYERCGFRHVGVYHEHGLLDAQWVDVIVMERLL